ncbi:MAG: gliding motility protein GldN, partial [Bacteroidota bacterium]
ATLVSPKKYLPPESMEGVLYDLDTIQQVDPDTEEIRWIPVSNEINYEDVKRFRLKEMWYSDENTSTMRVRILGIAPLKEVFDDNGNFRYETPMFWVYYPELRKELAQHKVFNPQNDSSLTSWEDLFEMRFFASYIYKASNVRDYRLEDYLSGVDLLLEADKIKQEIFNFEHDLWSY